MKVLWRPQSSHIFVSPLQMVKGGKLVREPWPEEAGDIKQEKAQVLSRRSSHFARQQTLYWPDQPPGSCWVTAMLLFTIKGRAYIMTSSFKPHHFENEPKKSLRQAYLDVKSLFNSSPSGIEYWKNGFLVVFWCDSFKNFTKIKVVACAGWSVPRGIR